VLCQPHSTTATMTKQAFLICYCYGFVKTHTQNGRGSSTSQSTNCCG